MDRDTVILLENGQQQKAAKKKNKGEHIIFVFYVE